MGTYRTCYVTASMGPHFPAHTPKALRCELERRRRGGQRALSSVWRKASDRPGGADSFAYSVPVPHSMPNDSAHMLLDRIVPALNDNLQLVVRWLFALIVFTHLLNLSRRSIWVNTN